MRRRDFLKAGSAASVGIFAGGMGLLSWAPRAHAATINVNLTATKGYVPMIDGTQAWMFSFSASGGVEWPGPTIVCQEGDTISVALNNTLNTPVAFKVGRTSHRVVANSGSGANLSFSAPAPGTYLYYDDQNNGVNRVMGLHGALIVMPAGVTNRSFDNGPTFVRQYKWVLGNVDPVWGENVRSNGDNRVTQINPDSFMPRYFTINGNAYEDTHEYSTEIAGGYNEAAMVRILNAGGMIHAPHFHGNHVEITSVDGTNFASNRLEKDAVGMYPLMVKDVIYPFKSPPDAWPLVPSSQVQHFPMHCHSEMSQTAGGGLYPHGMHAPIVMGQAPGTESDLQIAVGNL